jgi:hypothetical protein
VASLDVSQSGIEVRKRETATSNLAHRTKTKTITTANSREREIKINVDNCFWNEHIVPLERGHPLGKKRNSDDL